jgi:hypothetical protein
MGSRWNDVQRCPIVILSGTPTAHNSPRPSPTVIWAWVESGLMNPQPRVLRQLQAAMVQ